MTGTALPDLAKITRILEAAHAALTTSEARGSQVRYAYEALRREARDAVPPEAMGEFDRLFPASEGDTSIGKTRLAMLEGWLKGIVLDATRDRRMQFDAAADAAQRAKDRRGIGFGTSDADT